MGSPRAKGEKKLTGIWLILEIPTSQALLCDYPFGQCVLSGHQTVEEGGGASSEDT